MKTALWAILQDVYESMAAQLRSGAPRPAQRDGDAPELEAVSKPGPKSGRVAQINIVGSITRRGSIWSEFFGGATVEGTRAALRTVAADDTVSTVLLNIDSPGGTVDGLPELAAEIRKLRESKHVVAVANSLAASAAYWLASQADEVVAAPEALVGSIGVFTTHDDQSAWLEKMGIKTTYIHAGKYKVEANPDQPLSADAEQHLQGIVDNAYSLFVSDVAKGRGVTAAKVKSDYGEGRVLTAQEAKAAGMIDRVAGYHETIGRLTGVKAETPSPTLPRDDEAVTVAGEQPSPQPSPIGEGEQAPAEASDAQSVGNSLAAKRLRLELLEKI